MPGFTDGRDQHAEGSVAGEQLDGIHRFEGCIRLGGNKSRTREVLLLCLGRTDVRISVPSIRVEQYTKGVHQIPEACSWSPQAARNSPGDFLRQYASLAQSREDLVAQMDQIAQLFNLLGFSANQEKSQLTPAQQIQFLGFLIDSQNSMIRLTQEKTE